MVDYLFVNIDSYRSLKEVYTDDEPSQYENSEFYWNLNEYKNEEKTTKKKAESDFSEIKESYRYNLIDINCVNKPKILFIKHIISEMIKHRFQEEKQLKKEKLLMQYNYDIRTKADPFNIIKGTKFRQKKGDFLSLYNYSKNMYKSKKHDRMSTKKLKHFPKRNINKSLFIKKRLK